jgi:hypothetical protein
MPIHRPVDLLKSTPPAPFGFTRPSATAAHVASAVGQTARADRCRPHGDRPDARTNGLVPHHRTDRPGLRQWVRRAPAARHIRSGGRSTSRRRGPPMLRAPCPQALPSRPRSARPPARLQPARRSSPVIGSTLWWRHNRGRQQVSRRTRRGDLTTDAVPVPLHSFVAASAAIKTPLPRLLRRSTLRHGALSLPDRRTELRSGTDTSEPDDLDPGRG